MTLACAGGEVNTDTFGTSDTTVGDGDGDMDMGDGDGDTGDGDGDSGDGDGDSGDGDGDGDPCSAAGCSCDGGPDSCDEGLSCIEGTCQMPMCNINGTVEVGEECDDNNDFEGDGCDNDCTFTTVSRVAAGANHTCALIEGGRLRCWGLNNRGQLGYGNLDNIGDNEHPSAPGNVVLGENILEPMSGMSTVNAGADHTCALLDDETVRCWGAGGFGQLGQGNTEDVGDDEFPFSVNTLSINTQVLSVHAGGGHSCALVAGGGVRCWGLNNIGQLGYGNVNNLPVPLTIGLPLDGVATHIATGRNHSCALFDDNDVRCWGNNNRGQLGYGNTENIGDNETPGSVVPVPILPQGIEDGTPIKQVALGNEHSCVLFETGAVLCWGDNFYGQLGQGGTTTVGDNETLATLFPIMLGGNAELLALGKFHTCALMDDGDVKCWGRNIYGQLGRGNIEAIGDDELPADVSTIELGGYANWISAGDHHTCAVVENREVVCWGFNDYGQLGYGDTELRGDDEVPADVGGINLF